MIVGLTGGIGSGKTTVLKEFIKLGIPVYIADVEAKKIMNTSKEIQLKLIELFGKEAYQNNELNRSFIADKVFNDKELLSQLNHIVHPVVYEHFNNFAKENSTPYLVYENAILFENKREKMCDKIIVVAANLENRIARVMQRDSVTKERVLSRINNQWSQDAKIKKADFVIHNDDLSTLKKQVNQIHFALIAKNL